MASEAKFWPSAPQAEAAADAEAANRDEVLLRAAVKRGWFLVLAGFVFPPVLIGSARYGTALRRAGEPQGTMLIWVSAVVLVVRVALFVS